MEGLTLYSNNLFSKWGFCDGEIIGDWAMDNDDYRNGINTWELLRDFGMDEHVLLRRLVVKYLLPKIPHDLELLMEGFCTCHNPVRCEKIDGVEVPEGAHYDLDYKIPFEDVSVTIPFDEMIKILKKELKI